MLVFPPPFDVPRLIETYSRIVLPEPISKYEFESSLYFLSWGSSPMEQKLNILL